MTCALVELAYELFSDAKLSRGDHSQTRDARQGLTRRPGGPIAVCRQMEREGLLPFG